MRARWKCCDEAGYFLGMLEERNFNKRFYDVWIVAGADGMPENLFLIQLRFKLFLGDRKLCQSLLGWLVSTSLFRYHDCDHKSEINKLNISLSKIIGLQKS